MPSWNDILFEIQRTVRKNSNGQVSQDFNSVLVKYIRSFAEYRKRNVIVYYSDFLNSIKGPNIDINDSDMTGFMNCIHGLDKTKSLDLILHTPGGNPLATDAIVKYLRKMFGKNIEVFVPQMAMSAGTMLACSCKTIWMGKQSSLGPIDPQFNGIPAFNIKKEFEEAKKELVTNPESFRNWQILLSKYPPAFYYTVCDYINLSSKLVKDWLESCMFSKSKNAFEKADKIVSKLNANNGSHAKHFDLEECKKMGLKIKQFEDDSNLQDLVLSIFHCCSICGNQTPVCKIIANQNNKMYVVNGIVNLGVK
ncbi:MAG: serine protease [Bacilli bacterium]